MDIDGEYESYKYRGDGEVGRFVPDEVRPESVLISIDPAQVKDQARLDKLIGYFQRQHPYIPGYAVRKHLGLRNSSNLGEKANDLLVSSRQKHDGMSWSSTGSVALAALTALVRHNEHQLWFRQQTLRFSFEL